VAEDIATQVRRGDASIFGVMLESHLVEGRQDVVAGEALTYGQSVTDACMGWPSTETALTRLADAARTRAGR